MILLHGGGFLCFLLYVSSVVSTPAEDVMRAAEGDGKSKCLKSPDYPENYPNNYNKRQSISVSDGNIVVSFLDFDVEDGGVACDYDYVQFFDGNGKSVGKKLCGDSLPKYLTISTSTASVLFHSDSDATNKGFKLCYKSATSCLTSPGYPNNYPDVSNQKQSLSVPAGQSIQLTFKDFDVEADDECRYDYVEITDGDGNKVGGKMCGGSLPEKLTIFTSTASVLFHSDSSITRKGFKLCYQLGSAIPKCRDRKYNCKKLAQQGYCRSKSTKEINFKYMTENCPKACGICGDLPDYLLDQQSCATVSTIPAYVAEKYNLDSDFYGQYSQNKDNVQVKAYTGKYTEAYGFPITSSKNVDDRALMRMCYIVRLVYASHKMVRKAAHDNKARFIIIGRNERTTEIPAYSHLRKSWDSRARGLGGIVASSSEENLLAYSNKNSWGGFDMALHEISHNFHLFGLKKGIPKMYAEIKKAYYSARAAGKYIWKDDGFSMYARSDYREYFAQGVSSYIGDTWKHVPPHNAKQLEKYDPTLYDIIKKALACNDPEVFIYQHNDIDQVLSRQSRLRINYPDCKLEPSSNIPKEKDIVMKTKKEGVTYTWGRESCSFPWTYEGKTYKGCTQEGIHSWCPTYTENGKFTKSTEKHKGTWGYCQNSDEKMTPKQCSKTASGKPCIFPFLYLGLKQETCQGTGWCSTKVDDGTNMLEWSTCDASCYSRLEEENQTSTLDDMTKK